MALFDRILVDIDADSVTHPALERALVLARATGAALTITDVMAVSPYERRNLSAQLEEELIARKRAQLSRIVATIRDVKTESRLLVGRTATVLIQEVVRSEHDLLMRSHSRGDSATSAKEFGAVDMELLRKCPCAVMLVRQSPAAAHPRLAAAVNAGVADEAEHALNKKIVASAVQLAELINGSPMILNAWTPFGERMIQAHATDDVFAAYVNEARQRAENDLRALAGTLNGTLAHVPLIQRRGKPEDVIPQFAASEGLDILVMGTVARGGIPGLLIGNTAERVLRKVTCSVLALKPDGFVTPVRL